MPDSGTAPAPSGGWPATLDRTLGALPADAPGREVWQALGAADLIRPVYRDGTAAAGVRPDRLGRLLAAVDARFPVGTTLAVCVQTATALPLLAGDPAAAGPLAGALTGSGVVALAATDTGSGSDLTGMSTEVHIGAHGLRLDGEKRWITNATVADHYLVLARHRPGQHFTDFTWLTVPATVPGVRVRPADTPFFTGSGVGHVTFDGVRLARSHLLGRPGRGLPGFARCIVNERLAGALWAVALCRRALDATLRMLRTRAHGGGTLWDLDAVRLRHARCLVQLRLLDALTRELGDRIARRHDSGAAALLKAAVGTTVDGVLAECARLQGADGFAADGAHRLRAQAGVFGVGGGTTEVMLSAVADAAPALLDELRAGS
ncbi:acyl-CoA dehydrogenase [Streptomyces sp. YIM 98790]|uniref:acyl-CoA dehydrogenase n=1 Tax=Streptomyces sp. YIM 98790 TaxID=2689077 RepID=UPI001FB717D7|nr:acyl-CoA dehydrogenase [Streptomyces sp. YIM 98790]